MSKSITVDVQFNSPIEKVWSALTDSATLSKWMLFKSNTFKPEVGHEFQFSGAEGYDQTIECKVVEVDEPNKLAYTWSAPGVDGQQSDTLVIFTLTAADGGTSLNLVQTGFRDDAQQELGGAEYGWKHMFSELEGVLAS